MRGLRAARASPSSLQEGKTEGILGAFGLRCWGRCQDGTWENGSLSGRPVLKNSQIKRAKGFESKMQEPVSCRGKELAK